MAKMLLQKSEVINIIDRVTAASSNMALLTHGGFHVRLILFNPVLFNPVQFKPVVFKVTVVHFTPLQFKPVLFKPVLFSTSQVQFNSAFWASLIQLSKVQWSIPVGPAWSSAVATYRLFWWGCRSNICKSHMPPIWLNWTWTNWSIRSIWSNWSGLTDLNDVPDVNDLPDLNYLSYLNDLNDLSNLPDLANLNDLSDLNGLSDVLPFLSILLVVHACLVDILEVGGCTDILSISLVTKH